MKFSYKKWSSTSLGLLFHMPPGWQEPTQAALVHLEESLKSQSAW